MADLTPSPSQENIAFDGDYLQPLDSSPALPTVRSAHNSKQRKPPTVTPRTFTRFFTPKSSLVRCGGFGASRQVLRDITGSGANRRGRRTSKKESVQIGEADLPTHGTKRKRRLPISPEPTPELSSPLKRIRNQSLPNSENETSDVEGSDSANDLDTEQRLAGRRLGYQRDCQTPLVRSRGIQALGLQRELFGQVGKPQSLIRTAIATSNYDWQYETAKFSTRSEDCYVSLHVSKPTEHTLPFCTASCNTNSLVAIGDEDGGIRLLESAKDEKPPFSEPYLKFRPHTNAILDMAFSSDDMLLATASGDQSSRVIDMPNQCAIHAMAGHVSSVKQICFQPGNSSVIASSSRDGSIQIWDLRCKGFDAPVCDLKIALDPDAVSPARNHKMIWARSVNTIVDAHTIRQLSLPYSSSSNASKTPLASSDAPSKTESPGRRGDISVTGLVFLPPGREHLLMTGSEANASVKLWDLRTTHCHRRGHAMPLSITRQPESHSKYRHFGLTSMSLSGDAARLYTLCRDNTMYAYSTSHLILGHAPELSLKEPPKPRRSGGQEKDGLGPLYGFRHPNFHATTFYVKSSIRPAQNDRPELLAAGSSDGTPVLFPTDERHMQTASPDRKSKAEPLFAPARRPTLARVDSFSKLAGRLDDTIPIYQHGTALVRGHSREVTGLTWTKGGELITLGDDFSVRCWREGDEARDLRIGGENEGRRWGCGWAEATDGWDDEDG